MTPKPFLLFPLFPSFLRTNRFAAELELLILRNVGYRGRAINLLAQFAFLGL